MLHQWDYLIVTASNDAQARGYRRQLDLRRRLGLLEYVRQVMVIPDPDGKRIGSGGSTLCCLMNVLACELPQGCDIEDSNAWLSALQNLRILIVHAGGDSQRLPAYGPCGKIFVPVPGESDSCLPVTLFDRQLPVYLGLPSSPQGAGQVVITAGDVLLQFDPSEVSFNAAGITGLGCLAGPEEASKHGVYIKGDAGTVKSFLQKPSVDLQRKASAIDRYGQALLDIGVFNFDAKVAVELLNVFGAQFGDERSFEFTGELGEFVMDNGLDFYREICCCLGTDASTSDYITSVGQSGSGWTDAMLGRLFQSCRNLPFGVQTLSRCDFLHFGTSSQLISSGNSIIARDRGTATLTGGIEVNNALSASNCIMGGNYWVEGCTVDAPVNLGGRNLLVGVHIDKPLELPPGACLDCMPGIDRAERNVCFVRAYGIDDTFKQTIDHNATFCNMPLIDWIKVVAATADDLWPGVADFAEKTVFTARLFPAVSLQSDCRDWLWMFDPATAHPSQIANWHSADRYSLAEMAHLSDNDAFFGNRQAIRSAEIMKSLRRVFRFDSEFSADDLMQVIAGSPHRTDWVAAVLEQVHWHNDANGSRGMDSLVFPRILHTLASALEGLLDDGDMLLDRFLPGIADKLASPQQQFLDSLGLGVTDAATVKTWCDTAKALGFKSLGTTILSGKSPKSSPPKNSLRQDEIVWGHVAARLDTGGGWTDTPPYGLEYGGRVVNTAVDLNGQPPIQAYARVIPEPVIRIASIDLGARTEITRFEDLLDYRMADSAFGIAKAAITLSGFSPESALWPESITLHDMMTQFGGGLEITTLAAIPKGSGLGTSSIVSAVLIAVIKRVMGQTLTQRDLFNAVLRLEQALTTGGGWQDQIGGVVGGVKMITVEPGFEPDARIHYLPADVIDPVKNGGQTLLYYTGITRLAKNILEKVVGNYLDRKRHTMATLRKISNSASEVAEAISRKDIKEFGRLIDYVWRLNVQLDPESTNPAVDELNRRIRPYVFGAKLLGAGGGGFMLMVARSPEDAKKLRQMLTSEPASKKARFFDFQVNNKGLSVTVC